MPFQNNVKRKIKYNASLIGRSSRRKMNFLMEQDKHMSWQGMGGDVYIGLAHNYISLRKEKISL